MTYTFVNVYCHVSELKPGPTRYSFSLDSSIIAVAWTLLAMTGGIAAGFVFGVGYARKHEPESLTAERESTLEALISLVESTRQMNADVSTHKNELKNAQQQIAAIGSTGKLSVGELQEITANISKVMEANERLEDDLVVSKFQLETQARELDKSRKEARTDTLCNVANRKAFDEHLQFMISRARTSHCEFGLMIIDIDHFKRINDTFGHATGDEVLTSIGNVMTNCVRPGDFVARLGGDEFGIIQPEANSVNEFRLVLERIENVLRQPFEVSGKQLNCSFSIGIALAPNDSDQPEELMSQADVALYRSKNNGRACSSFYEPKMDEELIQTRKVVAELSQAVEEGELQLYYQPIYSCSDWRLATCEALLRWNHPERGLLAPNAFLPAAEESGLIVQLGEWVVREATRAAAEWPNDVRVAVNFSPVQFHPRFKLFDMIMNCLEESGLAPKRLEIEVTENVLLRDFDLASNLINKLRSAGMSVVLDDFGTGHSSLNYLKRLAFDKIKLDRSFVWGADTCAKSAAILNSVASLGRDLSIRSTAEGVETLAQLERVSKAGFTEVQGYYFAKPTPNPVFEDARKPFPSVDLPIVDGSTNTV